ncbi:unnamed protein product [Clonostachys rhizophaga]|uniref:Uncharacterized protein n=1 Tax=Clonostachys rhizophaga TaxID=160324 RepID=A0A9N9YH54_9HYPO|nr:unnamed protein product [Clonostachys rhizophaga]
MALQTQASPCSPLSIQVDILGCQLDVKSAAQKEPNTLRTELIKALRYVTLSASDLALIELQETFRVSLGRPRIKTPDRLASVVHACRRRTIDEHLWESQIWRQGGILLVNAISSAISNVSLDESQTADILRLVQLKSLGGQPAVTAFHLMGCPENLENGTQLGEKFFAYGGTLALAASAVAISDDAKVMPLLEKLPESHSTSVSVKRTSTNTEESHWARTPETEISKV